VTIRILTNISFLNKTPLIAAKRGYETKLEKFQNYEKYGKREFSI